MLIAAWPSHAALAVVQTASCSTEGAASSCTTGSITSTTGNLFVASAGYCCANFVSITDSKSNTYTDSVAEQSISSAVGRQQYKENGAGGATHTFTLTGDAAGFFPALSVTEISGAATSSALDQVAGDTETFDTNHATPATSTTSQADEILVGFGTTSGSTTYTTDTGAGWVEQTNITTDGNTEGLLAGTRIVSATGTYSYTYTTGSSVQTVQGIATYKAAAAASARQRCIGCGTDKKIIGE